MKKFATLIALPLLLSAGAVSAQSSGANSIRVQPGHFCAINKCVRFSRDLSRVSIQARTPVSVKSYGLRNSPVISAATYREIFKLALRQPGINDDRN